MQSSTHCSLSNFISWRTKCLSFWYFTLYNNWFRTGFFIFFIFFDALNLAIRFGHTSLLFNILDSVTLCIHKWSANSCCVISLYNSTQYLYISFWVSNFILIHKYKTIYSYGLNLVAVSSRFELYEYH